MAKLDSPDQDPYISVFYGEEVRFDNTTKEWTYDNTQFWFPGFQYSFVALYPAQSHTARVLEYKAGSFSFTYTLPSDYKSTADLLISTHRRNYTGGTARPVRFSFNHILTNVNVLVSYIAPANGPSSISINSLTFSEIPTKAKYSIKPASLIGTATMTSDWVYNEDTLQGWSNFNMGTVTVKFNNPDIKTITSNSGATPLFSADNALLLLPTPYDPDFPPELELNYTTDTGETETVTAVIPRGWNPGTSLTMSLEIVNSTVHFGIDVEEWKDGSSSITIVPRK